MRLLYSPASPYARKVRMALIEKGLGDAVELVRVDPLSDLEPLLRHAPLGKVPALVLDNGQVLFDSPVICAYLDEVGPGAPLIPRARELRFDALAREALADGIMDAGFATVMERRRPPESQSSQWLERWSGGMLRAVSYADTLPLPENRLDIGDVALASALAYVDFRLPDLGWDRHAGRLRRWLEHVQARPSFALTRP